jgi:hypothetical protein
MNRIGSKLLLVGEIWLTKVLSIIMVKGNLGEGKDGEQFFGMT